MKVQNFLFTSLVCICLTVSSCIPEKDLHEEKPVTYTEVNFSVGGDCSVTDKPMSRADASSKELYGINVAMLVKNPNDANFTSKPYAYGIFDHTSVQNLKLNLIDGYSYRVSCTMIADGVDSLAQNGGYVRPFTIDKNRTNFGKVGNKFITSERPDGTQEYLYDLEVAQIGTAGQANILRPFIKRYHGFIETPIISKDAPTQNDLEVYRRYFGVKFKVVGLQNGLKMKIQIDDSPAIWLSSSNAESESTYVSMKNLTAKVEPNRILTENGRVIATVYKEGEEPEQILNYTIAFKRNYMHTIAISDIDHCGTPSGVKIKVDEEEMGDDGQQDLPWQGGN